MHEKAFILKKTRENRGKKMTIESSKNLGGIGAVLMLIGTLPIISTYTFGILGILGLILVVVALYGLANIYQEKSIFTNSIYGLIAGIVGVVIAVVIVIVAVLNNLKTLLQDLYPSWNGSWSTISSLSGKTPDTSAISSSTVFSLITGAIVAFVVFWIFLIIWAFFARKSLKSLATKSTVGLFSTASLILLIGAFLTIIFIGVILIWVAILLLAIAFFQIKPQPEQPMATMAPPPSMPTPV
jgi:uncharacterized membrane protein